MPAPIGGGSNLTYRNKQLINEFLFSSFLSYFEFQIVESLTGNMLWNKGQLIYRREYEAMLYHLVCFKQKYAEPLDLQKQIPEKFRIGKKKIYT